MKNKKITFFTEAGTTRGMGHLVRSYTIYKKFKKENYDVSFYLDSDINYDSKFNNLKYFEWNEFDFEQQFEIIFIDSYIASLLIYKQLSLNTKICVYIDDYARLDYPQGIILNFAPNADKSFFKVKNKKNTYLLGIKYIPIREEFLIVKKQEKEQLFIMLGANDIGNHTIELIDAIKHITINKVVITTSKSIADKLKNYKNVITLLNPTNTELISSMSNSSLAISTASMNLYELSYLNIPTIIIAVSKNQHIGVTQLIKHKLAYAYVDINSLNVKEEYTTPRKTNNFF